ncbi:unnamed protein product [Auanema sp. JU1783]|nr:unnamed protein product [Auanema sp. JU1783]
MTEEAYVIVKYDYLAQEEQELTVKKNERLRLLDDSKNWWKVINENNKVGFVPSNYVRRESLVDKAKGTIKGITGIGKPRAPDFSTEVPSAFNSPPDTRPVFSTNNSFNSNGGQGFNKLSAAMSCRVVVKFTYEPQIEDELGLTRGEVINVIEKSSDGWWKGEKNGVTGWFPSNYVEEEAAKTMSNGNGTVENKKPINDVSYTSTIPKLTTTLERVVGLYGFEASAQEELSFRKGEKLDIVGHPVHDPDWWMAKNSRGQEGLVPRNYIEVLSESPSATTNGSGGGIQNEVWYFGRLTRDEADALLRSGRQGEYLVRDSESTPGDWSISMRGIEKNKHFKVQSVNGELRIGTRNFPDMKTLIEHYKVHPIFSSDTEKLHLTMPLPK